MKGFKQGKETYTESRETNTSTLQQDLGLCERREDQNLLRSDGRGQTCHHVAFWRESRSGARWSAKSTQRTNQSWNSAAGILPSSLRGQTSHMPLRYKDLFLLASSCNCWLLVAGCCTTHSAQRTTTHNALEAAILNCSVLLLPAVPYRLHFVGPCWNALSLPIKPSPS